jgi:DNA polymerase-3 subunit delta'
VAKKPRIQVEEFPAPPLARIDAPVPFSGIVGQDRALSVLEHAMRAGRIHHCWIFHGPRGVGKFRAALSFASMVLDPTCGPTLTGGFEPDPESQVQQLLRTGSHPDLHVVHKELAKYHEEKSVRDKKLLVIPKEVITKYVVTPATMASSLVNDAPVSKVFIVDEAELLDIAPQNALLKTLEEPPARTLIILITDNLHVLLPTIRSRAQQVAFTPLGESAMKQWIKALNDPPPADETAWLLQFCAGSPGTFVSARASGVFALWQALQAQLDEMRLGRFPIDVGAALGGFAETYASNWVKEFPHLSKEAANRQGADWVFRLLGFWLRGELRTRVASNADAAPVMAAVEAIRVAESASEANTSIGFVMEQLASQIVAAFADESHYVA